MSNIRIETLKVIKDCNRRAKDIFYKDYPEILKDDIQLKKNAERILNKLDLEK